MTNDLTIMCRGPMVVGGGPAETLVQFSLSWDEVRETVRTGQFPTRIADAFIIEALSIGRSQPQETP